MYLKLQKRFSVLVADEGPEAVLKDAPKQAEYELCSSTKRKWCVTAVGDSLLQRMEAAI